MIASGPQVNGRRGGSGAGGFLPAAADPCYAALADTINEQIEPVFHCSVTLVQYPSQGDFPWYYENANQVFNAGTFGYLSARVLPGDAPAVVQLSPAGGFPNAYTQLLADLTWTGGPGIAGLVAELLANTTGPQAANGGMQTIDPVTGAVSSSWQVGYAVNTPLASIQAALTDPTRSLTVTLDAGGKGALRIDYPGVTMVSASPAPWQQGSGIGWFYPDPLTQAFANARTGVPGFQFSNPPPYQPGPPSAGGGLGWITGLLVCATPQVTVLAAPGHPGAAAAAHVANDILDGLSLLGLPPPTVSSPALRSQRRQRGRYSALTARRAGYQPSVPLLQQTAYVIGAVLGFPGAP